MDNGGDGANTFSSERVFELWEFKRSHHLLLIRSHKTAQMPNIDLIFGGVFMLEIPSTMYGVEISVANASEITEIERRYGGRSISASQYFRLASGGKIFFVGALTHKIDENFLDYGETTLE